MNSNKTKIIDAAIELFKKNGYNKTTINQICKCSGLTKGTFYYHFNSKDEVIIEYCNIVFNDVEDILPSIISISDAKEKLWKVIEYSTDKVCSLPVPLVKELLRLCTEKVFMKFDQSLVESQDGHNWKLQMFYNLIIKAQEEGTIDKDKDALLLMDVYYVAFIGVILDWSSNHGKYDIKEKLYQVFKVIFG
ncbi:TetR/AcrR family transcriptional regulator [Terrisporobacter sp.]